MSDFVRPRSPAACVVWPVDQKRTHASGYGIRLDDALDRRPCGLPGRSVAKIQVTTNERHVKTVQRAIRPREYQLIFAAYLCRLTKAHTATALFSSMKSRPRSQRD